MWLIYAAILFNLNVLYNFGRSWSCSTLKLPLLSSTANTRAARGENCRRGPIFQHMKVGAPALHSAFAGILETSFWPSITWGRFSLLDPWLALLTLWKWKSSSSFATAPNLLLWQMIGTCLASSFCKASEPHQWDSLAPARGQLLMLLSLPWSHHWNLNQDSFGANEAAPK